MQLYKANGVISNKWTYSFSQTKKNDLYSFCKRFKFIWGSEIQLVFAVKFKKPITLYNLTCLGSQNHKSNLIPVNNIFDTIQTQILKYLNIRKNGLKPISKEMAQIIYLNFQFLS